MTTEPEQFCWSPGVLPLIESLRAHLLTRTPVGYQRRFVDDYVPYHSSFLPKQLADELFEAGRHIGLQTLGSDAHAITDAFRVDLSWFSSALEGVERDLDETTELFALGAPPVDGDELLLLNHKDGIDYLLKMTRGGSLSINAVANLQAILMRDLLPSPLYLGSIRSSWVQISGSVYIPLADHVRLEEMLRSILQKAGLIENPVEAAFFLWVNIAYLQPFLDGNKRSSRLCANFPLLQRNCVPLSIWDVSHYDYATAMLGVYEQCNVAAAVELFAFVYRLSIQRFRELHEG